MSASMVASIVGIGVGLKALTSSGGSSVSAGGATAAAQQVNDPFVNYRDKLGQLYSGALQQGSTLDITKMPGYSQFETGVMTPALEASKRSSAASGMLRSGNEQIALDKQAQQGYYGFMTDYLNRLATGSGATTLPQQSSALQAGQNYQASQLQGLGAVTQGLGQLYNANQGSSSYSAPNLPELGYNAAAWNY